MEASKLEMCKSLVEWFEAVTKGESQTGGEADLSDGVAMARALHKFAPDFFTGKRWIEYHKECRAMNSVRMFDVTFFLSLFFLDIWLMKIKVDVGTNWRLKGKTASFLFVDFCDH